MTPKQFIKKPKMGEKFFCFRNFFGAIRPHTPLYADFTYENRLVHLTFGVEGVNVSYDDFVRNFV